MKIADIVNTSYARIAPGASLRDAARELSSSQASDLMVVDAGGAFVGVLSEGDLIRAALPRYEEILRDGGSLADALENFIERGKELAGKPIELRLLGRDDQSILATPCDILAPCALGAVLNAKTIPLLQTKIVCGAANHQLERHLHLPRLALGPLGGKERPLQTLQVFVGRGVVVLRAGQLVHVQQLRPPEP